MSAASKCVFAIVGILAAFACAPEVSSLGPLKIAAHWRPGGGDDRFRQTFEGERLIVDVESPSGIGGATFRPGRGVWPARLAFRFHLRGLEGFEARGAKEFRTSIAEKPLTEPPVVDVPHDVYEGADALAIGWVDFYR